MKECPFLSNPKWVLIADRDDQLSPATPENLVTVLEGVKSLYEKYLGFSIINQRPLTVRQHAGKPMATWDKSMIYLTHVGRQWDRYVYQFSHEMCHIVVEHRVAENLRWFEEAICELASFFFLKEMGCLWACTPPYPNWREYHASFTCYFEKQKKNACELKESEDAKAFLRAKLKQLEQDCYMRATNETIALVMLPIFESTPEIWHAVRLLGDVEADLSFEESLARWRSISPKRAKSAIDEIMRVLV